MQTRLLMSPPWVQGAVAGVGGAAVYGGVFIVMSFLIGSLQTSRAELVAIGVFGGIVAAVVGAMMSTRRARVLVERPELAVLRPSDRAAAILTSRKGPVPDDPRVRSAATKLTVENAARAYR